MRKSSSLRRKRIAALAMALGFSSLGLVATASTAHADAYTLRPIVQYYHWGRQDNFAAVTAQEWQSAESQGYELIRELDGYAMAFPTTNQSTQAPLSLWWHAARGDYMSTATPTGVASARSAGYVYVGQQGFVWTYARAKTVPLYLYWNGDRQDNYLTSTPEGIAAAESAGYVPVRIEGWVFPTTSI
ncbi:hypothetical protein ACFCW4_07255 [Streptomyces virginiae]|uniref:hypothetical protein n=1 Tax=Streptomyces virginiae TaxID=1961 RepID=UPI0035DBAFCE